MEDRFLEKIFRSIDSLYDSDVYWLFMFLSFIALAALVVAGLGINAWIQGIIDKRTAKTQILTGKLIDKKYVGEENSTSTGTAIVNTSSGVGVGITSSSSHEDEQFLFFLNADKVYKCPVDMQNYYHFNIGDKIKFSVLIGGKTGEQLKIKLTTNE